MFLKLTSTKGLYLPQLKIKFTLRIQTLHLKQNQTDVTNHKYNIQEFLLTLRTLLSLSVCFFIICGQGS